MKAACARLITGQEAEDLQKARELASHRMRYQMAEDGRQLCRKGGRSRCKELLMKFVIGANKMSVSLNTVLQLKLQIENIARSY
ncbi:hypothetical protein VTO42DRAFT_1225 [Malbranchea cinnamomea]